MADTVIFCRFSLRKSVNKSVQCAFTLKVAGVKSGVNLYVTHGNITADLQHDPYLALWSDISGATCEDVSIYMWIFAAGRKILRILFFLCVSE